MKQLAAGVILLALVGIAGFLYRNTVEQPRLLDTGVVCPEEVRECPDGTTVVRSGLTCAFAACAHPNISLDRGSIAFVLPEGYQPTDSRGAEIARYTKQVPSAGEQVIVISRYPITDEQTSEDVILFHSRFQPADEVAAMKDERFVEVVAGDYLLHEVTVERNDDTLHTLYYLVRASDVVRFEIVERGIGSWMSDAPAREFPEHRVLWKMLETLQIEGV